MEKLAEDQRFLNKAAERFRFASFYAGDMGEKETLEALQEEILSSVRTVVRDYDEKDVRLLRYLTEHITEQRAVINGPEYSFRRDFRTRCVETALGYLSVCCDMERIAYPKGDEDSWDELSVEFLRNVEAYGRNLEGFSGTTAAECDERIRSFLALDYTESRKGDTICLQVSGTDGPAWFIFRNYGNDIKEVEGGEFQELEEGVYLIEAKSSEISIVLEPADERFYY